MSRMVVYRNSLTSRWLIRTICMYTLITVGSFFAISQCLVMGEIGAPVVQETLQTPAPPIGPTGPQQPPDRPLIGSWRSPKQWAPTNPTILTGGTRMASLLQGTALDSQRFTLRPSTTVALLEYSCIVAAAAQPCEYPKQTDCVDALMGRVRISNHDIMFAWVLKRLWRNGR